jgi:Fe-S cluster assembly protein SufD
MTTTHDNGLLADHAALAADLPGAGAHWIDALRADGARRFAGLGLPTRKVEEWKYTDLSALARSRFAPCCGAAAASAEPKIPDPLVAGGPQAVFINGRFDAERSTLGGAPAGITALPLAEALRQCPELLESTMGRVAELGRKPLVALNTAWLADGFVLHLARDVVLKRPIELVFWGEAGAGGISTPIQFRREAEWCALAEALGARIVRADRPNRLGHRVLRLILERP